MEAIAHCHGSPLMYVLLTACRCDLSITQFAGGPTLSVYLRSTAFVCCLLQW